MSLMYLFEYRADTPDGNAYSARQEPAIHIFKIWGGNIHEIEAIGIVSGYESPTGWE